MGLQYRYSFLFGKNYHLLIWGSCRIMNSKCFINVAHIHSVTMGHGGININLPDSHTVAVKETYEQVIELIRAAICD